MPRERLYMENVMEKFECTQRLTTLIAESEKFEYTRRFTTLIAEAGVLAERINLARFEETIPDADHTTRLCEILDIAIAILTEGDAIQKEAQTLAEKYGIEGRVSDGY
jgi:hypothetical protein